METNVYRLAALVHSQVVADCVQHEALQTGWPVHTCVTNYDTAVADAKALLHEGYEVLLCHGGFRESVFHEMGRCTVFIERSDIDLIEALSKAKAVSTHVGLTAYLTESLNLELMESLLAMRIELIRFTTKQQLEEGIKQGIERGLHVFVGGGGTARIVNQYGGQIFLDMPQPANIRNAVARAVMLADSLRVEVSYTNTIQAMLNHSKEGVVCVNAEQKCLFCNEQAKRLLGIQHMEQLRDYFPLLLLDKVLHSAKPYTDKVIKLNAKRLYVSTFPMQLSTTVHGAVSFIHDVVSLQKINQKIGDALYSRGFVAKYTHKSLTGASTPMVQLRESICRYASTDIAVCIQGETGTGKELTAHALHSASLRRNKPFVAINCTSLPESLLESELFGYEEGAFTGAKRGGKPGLFEMAHGGTLFLDEIGDLTAAVQVRLLRVLEVKEVMRIGGDRYASVDVRLVCASNKDLASMVEQQRFRMDLYFRLAGLCVRVPPLRERLEDIPELLAPLFAKYNKSVDALPQNLREVLSAYEWPGNVRELLAVMENYLLLLGPQEHNLDYFLEVFSKRNLLFARSTLSAGPFTSQLVQHPVPSLLDASQYHEIKQESLKQQLERHRQSIVRETLYRHKGNIKQTARALDMSYSRLRAILGHAE